jgi:hypothetical protein
VRDRLEEFRRVVVGYALDFQGVFPGRGTWPGPDDARMERYPSRDAWPKVLGYAETDPAKYRVVQDPAREIRRKSGGGFVLDAPLDAEITTENSVTLLCRKGVAPSGIWVAKGYSSLICTGEMAGRLFFSSYATAVVDGDLTGAVTAQSYFTIAVKGRFTGKMFTESYAMIHLLQGMEGDLELANSKVYVKGHLPRAALDRIRGIGEVYADESDLGPGRHAVGRLSVFVGRESVAPPAGAK